MKDEIKMRLLSVSEDKFMLDNYNAPEKMEEDRLDITLGHRPIPKVETDEMELIVSITYSYDAKVLLDCEYTFHFHVENLKDYVVENTKGALTIKNLIPQVIDVAVGTMRGLIMARTAGTKLSQYPLPIVNALSIPGAK